MQDGKAVTGSRAASKKKKKGPNPVDVHVGSRVRLRRMLVGISQEKLGDSMGLTFQQIQKYEKGVNRIGASRLFMLSQVLDVPVQFFFEGMPAIKDEKFAGIVEDDTEAYLYEFLNTRDGLELNRAFMKLGDPDTRRAVIELVRALGRGNSSGKS